MAYTQYINQVQSAYIAYYGRPADADGLIYWANKIDQAGNLDSIMDAFGASTEYTQAIGNASVSGKINQLFQNMFGRDADAAGLAYYLDQVQTGKTTIAKLATNIYYGATADDATQLSNKLTAAKSYTDAMDTAAERDGYNSASLTTVKNWLAAITSDAATLTTATAAVAATVTSMTTAGASAGSATGTTFTLTTGADNITGTSGNDTIGGINSATATTFNAVDKIDGGAGTDTLSLDLNAAYAGGATVANVEVLNLTNAGATFIASGFTGLTDFNVNAGIANTGTGNSGLNNIMNLGVANRTGLLDVFTFTDAAVAGAADALTVTLNNVTGNGTVNIDSATALGAGVETVTLKTTGAASSITLASNDATISTLNVTGDKNLTVVLSAAGGLPSTSVKAVDASALTGNLNISGMGAADQSMKGGTGNDTFNYGANFTTADTVDGGAGTDTLAVTTALTAAQWARATNMEAVSFTMGANVTQDASLLTGVNTFATSGAFTQTLSKLSNSATITVGTTTTTLTAALNDVTGLSDALTVNMNPSSGATASFTLGTLSNVTGLEQLNIVANGSSNAIVNTITTDSVTAKHVVTGSGSLTLAATAATQIDATALTGNLIATTSLGTAVNYQGGAGNDTLVGGTAADVLVGNAGNDTITGLAGADIINVGTGNDTLALHTTADSFTGTITSGVTVLSGSIDVVTGMGTGDVINLLATGNALAAAVDWTAATAISGSIIAAGGVDTIALVRGNYSTATGIWTTSASGTDTLFQFDNNGTTAAGTIDSIILVGTTNSTAAFGTDTFTLA